MIIIQKAPSEIKRFHASVSLCDSSESVQRSIQRLYTDDCFALDMKINDPVDFDLETINPLMLPGSVVLSRDKKKIIVNRNYTAELRLYQLRARSRTRTENILFEPFYPGFHSSLLDIYGILTEPPYTKKENAYRFSAMHTPRIRQYIQKRFRSVLPDLFPKRTLALESFESFYLTIHELEPAQLEALFQESICFVKIS